jgi:multiple sugar transport system permease protein
MLLLMVFPLFMAIWLGLNFMTFRNMGAPEFIGLRNYAEVLSDERFWQSFRFTLLFMFVTVPAEMVIGFIVALLLDQISARIRGIYLAAFLLPFIVVPVVGTLMFKQLFEPSGPIAWFFRSVLQNRFVMSEGTVKTLIFMHAIWYVTPYVIVTLFAGLQTLSTSLIEAAQIDGANRWNQIRYVAIPHLSKLLVMVGMISLMDAYRVFDSVFVLTEQNAIYKADTVMLYNFDVALSVQRLGKANAMAVLTVVGIMVILIPFVIRTYRDQMEER